MRYLALALLALSFNAQAETVKEMSMPTDVGEIILTVEPCPLSPNHGHDYYAYFTDKGNPDHLGCWNADNDIVQIWIPEISGIATYKKSLFKPRTSL